jgi:DNA invertase Pin-like site-specific DNA recombinase
MLMQMVGSFAEFERSMIRERTRAGLAAAREEGRIGGRRAKLNITPSELLKHLLKLRSVPAATAGFLLKNALDTRFL